MTSEVCPAPHSDRHWLDVSCSPPSLLPGNPPDGRLARPHQLHTPPCKIHTYELENFFVNFYGETLGILQLYMQKCIINIFYCGDIVEILSMSMCFSFYLSQFDEKLTSCLHWVTVFCFTLGNCLLSSGAFTLQGSRAINIAKIYNFLHFNDLSSWWGKDCNFSIKQSQICPGENWALY